MPSTFISCLLPATANDYSPLRLKREISAVVSRVPSLSCWTMRSGKNRWSKQWLNCSLSSLYPSSMDPDREASTARLARERAYWGCRRTGLRSSSTPDASASRFNRQVDQTHLGCLRSFIELSTQNHFHGPAVSHKPRQALGSPSTGNEAHLDLGQADSGTLCRPTRRSQAMANSKPPPKQRPLMAATRIRGLASIRRNRS